MASLVWAVLCVEVATAVVFTENIVALPSDVSFGEHPFFPSPRSTWTGLLNVLNDDLEVARCENCKDESLILYIDWTVVVPEFWSPVGATVTMRYVSPGCGCSSVMISEFHLMKTIDTGGEPTGLNRATDNDSYVGSGSAEKDRSYGGPLEMWGHADFADLFPYVSLHFFALRGGCGCESDSHYLNTAYLDVAIQIELDILAIAPGARDSCAEMPCNISVVGQGFTRDCSCVLNSTILVPCAWQSVSSVTCTIPSDAPPTVFSVEMRITAGQTNRNIMFDNRGKCGAAPTAAVHPLVNTTAFWPETGPGGTVAMQCVQGYYGVGSVMCEEERGATWEVNGADCEECMPVGNCTVVACTNSSDERCVQCLPGFYRTDLGMCTECVTCPVGYNASGAPCSGATLNDTQSCEAYPCPEGSSGVEPPCECDVPGYVGSPTFAEGRWSSCEVFVCSEAPTAVVNGVAEDNNLCVDVPFGQFCSLSCVPGFAKSTNFECTAEGWTSPTCNAAPSCLEDITVSNGQFSEVCNGKLSGETCRFACDGGYQISSTLLDALCTGGVWDVPSCERIPVFCDAPVSIASQAALSASGVCGSMVGDTCGPFECAGNSDIVTDDPTVPVVLVCTATGVWAPTVPACLPRQQAREITVEDGAAGSSGESTGIVIATAIIIFVCCIVLGLVLVVLLRTKKGKSSSMKRRMEEEDDDATVRRDTEAIGDYLFDQTKNARPIAKGGFGEVYKIKMKNSKEWVALKVLGHGVPAIEQAGFVREATVLARLLSRQSPWCIKMLCFVDHPPMIALEFAVGGSLHALLEENKHSIEDAMRMTKDSIACLEFLHSENIVHFDVKPKNFLIMQGGRVVICDLAASVDVDGDGMPVDLEAFRQNVALVSDRYVAPERVAMIKGGSLASTSTDLKKVDVYAWTICAFRIWNKEEAFLGETNIAEAVAKDPAHRPVFSSECGAPTWLRDLLAAAWSADPDQRPSAGEIIAMIDANEGHGDDADATVRLPSMMLSSTMDSGGAAGLASVDTLASMPVDPQTTGDSGRY